jgi:hypothetical protein
MPSLNPLSLDPKEASILARIAQYEKLPLKYKTNLLSQLSSAPARSVGELLVGGKRRRKRTATRSERRAATVLREWAQSNQSFLRARKNRNGSSIAEAS